MFWKSGENFNMKQLTNLMLVGYNFTENFTVDLAMGILQYVWNGIDSCFSWWIYRSITIKRNQFAKKKVQAVWFFKETNKRVNTCLTHCSQNKTKKEKKMNNKHSRLLLVFRENPTKWNYGTVEEVPCWRLTPHLL